MLKKITVVYQIDGHPLKWEFKTQTNWQNLGKSWNKYFSTFAVLQNACNSCMPATLIPAKRRLLRKTRTMQSSKVVSTVAGLRAVPHTHSFTSSLFYDPPHGYSAIQAKHETAQFLRHVCITNGIYVICAFYVQCY